MCTHFVEAVTSPNYFIHSTQGKTTVDGLGWVWQCNFFGHYCLVSFSTLVLWQGLICRLLLQFRSLQPLLSASKPLLGARVIWTSSIEASPSFYNPEDWQLVRTEYSYAAAKYQIDLIATLLDCLAVQQGSRDASINIRHVIAQPGIASTNISSELVGWFMEAIKILTLYIVRLCVVSSATTVVHVFAFALARPEC